MMHPGGQAITCDAAHFGDRDPFPDVAEKICQCAADVSLYQLKISGVNWGAVAVGMYTS
jgi:hypothetical protein